MKKGFTLIELLAVIILMALLLLISTSAISFLTKQKEGEILELKKKNFNSAVELYMDERADQYTERVFYKYCVSVADFIADSKYTEEDFFTLFNIAAASTKTILVEFVNGANFKTSIVDSGMCATGKRLEKIEYAASFGGSGNDTSLNMKTIPGGGFLISGKTTSTDGDFTGLTNNGNYDGFVTLLDENFNILWTRSVGGKGLDYFSQIEIIDNKIYAMGLVQGTVGNDTVIDFFGMNNIPDDMLEKSIMIWVFDMDGNVLDKTLLGPNDATDSNSEPKFLYSNEKIYVASGFSGNTGTQAGFSTYSGAYVLQLSKDLDVEWSNTLSHDMKILQPAQLLGYKDHITISCPSDALGGLAADITTGEFSLTGQGNNQYAKYGTDGSRDFLYSYGGSAAEGYESILWENDGYTLTGSTTSRDGIFASRSGKPVGSYAAYVLRINPEGNVTRNTIIETGTNGTINFYLPEKGANLGGYLYGWYSEASEDFAANTQPPFGYWRSYVAKLSTSGNVEWIIDFGSDNPMYECFNGYTTGDGIALICDPSSISGTFSDAPSNSHMALVKINEKGEITNVEYTDKITHHVYAEFIPKNDSEFYIIDSGNTADVNITLISR